MADKSNQTYFNKEAIQSNRNQQKQLKYLKIIVTKKYGQNGNKNEEEDITIQEVMENQKNKLKTLIDIEEYSKSLLSKQRPNTEVKDSNNKEQTKNQETEDMLRVSSSIKDQQALEIITIQDEQFSKQAKPQIQNQNQIYSNKNKHSPVNFPPFVPNGSKLFHQLCNGGILPFQQPAITNIKPIQTNRKLQYTPQIDSINQPKQKKSITVTPNKGGNKITCVLNNNFIYLEIYQPITNRYFQTIITLSQLEELKQTNQLNTKSEIQILQSLQKFYQYLLKRANFTNEQKERKGIKLVQTNFVDMKIKINIDIQEQLIVLELNIKQIPQQAVQVKFNQSIIELNSNTNKFSKSLKELEQRIIQLEKNKCQNGQPKGQINSQALKKYLHSYEVKLATSQKQIKILKQQNNNLKQKLTKIQEQPIYIEINKKYEQQLKKIQQNLQFLMSRSGFGNFFSTNLCVESSLKQFQKYNWKFETKVQFEDVNFDKNTNIFQNKYNSQANWKCITTSQQLPMTSSIVYFSIKIVKIANEKESLGFQFGIRTQQWATCLIQQCCKYIMIYETGKLNSHGKIWDGKYWHKISTCNAFCKRVNEGDVITGFLDRRQEKRLKFAWYNNNSKIVEAQLPQSLLNSKLYPLLGMWGPGDQIQIL